MSSWRALATFLVCSFAFVSAPALRGESGIALVGGTVINPADASITPDAVVVIRGGRIESVKSRRDAAVDPDVRTLNCEGKFIIPGLWDMHVHLAGVVAEPKWSKETLLPVLVANGITGVRDMGGDLEALLQWRGEIESGTLIGPRIVAAGPFLADAKPGTPATLPVANAEQAREAVRELKSRHADFVKILSELSRESYLAIITEAAKEGLDVVGHLPHSVTALDASNAGQKSVEHIFYSDLAFDCSGKGAELRERAAEARRNHDSALAKTIRDEANATFNPRKADALFETLVRNRTWIVPTLIGIYTGAHALDSASKDADDPRLAFLPSGLRAKWSEAELSKELKPDVAEWYGRQFENDLKLTRLMHGSGVMMMAGSDSLDTYNFPGSSLHDELKLLVLAGFTPLAALQAATINPARFLGRDKLDGFGSIQPGRRADLVVLDANPLENITNTQKIHAVILDGRLLDRAELDRLLEHARAAAAHD